MWPPLEPRDTVTDDLVKELRSLRARAGNIRGQRQQELQHGYLQWAGEAVRELRGYVSAVDIDRLVRTRGYSEIMAATPNEQRFLAELEIDDAVARFDETIAAVDAFRRQWASPASVVVLDTNAFIDTAFDTYDWFEVTNTRADTTLRLVVLMVVVDELDGLKNRGESKTRAAPRKALKTLEALLTSPSERAELPAVRHNGQGLATVEVLVDPPTGGRLPIADDEIVRQATLLQRLTGHQTHLVSNDTGMLLRARLAGLGADRITSLDGSA